MERERRDPGERLVTLRDELARYVAWGDAAVDAGRVIEIVVEIDGVVSEMIDAGQAAPG